MTSDELAAEVAEAIAAATGRVLKVGKEQYDDGSGVQKFEKLKVKELFDWSLEELDDLMVYNVMLRVRLKRVLAAVEKAEARMTETEEKRVKINYNMAGMMPPRVAVPKPRSYNDQQYNFADHWRNAGGKPT